MNTVNSKKIYYFAVLLQLFIVFFIAWFAWLYFVPVKVLEPQRQPYNVLNKKVRVGEKLTYVVDICKYQSLQGIVSRVFYETTTKTYYPAIASMGNVVKGCDRTNVAILIPPSIPPGHYILLLNVSYQVNYIRQEHYQLTTEEFEVLPTRGGVAN